MRPTLLLKITLAVALVAGTGAAVEFATTARSSPSVYNLGIDTDTYDAIAQRLVSTHDLRAIPVRQPPGFVILLALIYVVFGHSYLAAKLTFCALLSATALLTALVAWRCVGPLEGTIAGTLTIFSPILVAYAATLQYEIPAAFLSMLVTALLVLLPRPSRPVRDLAWAAAVATTCAAAVLVREVLGVLFPIALAAVLLRHRAALASRQTVTIAVLMGTLFAVPIAAWSWIQYRHVGQVVMLSDKGGLTLRMGNNAVANGTYHGQLEPVAEPSGWTFIRERPMQAASLAVRKGLYFWGLARDPWTVPHRSAVVVSRALLNRVPFEWTLAVAPGGAMAVLFLAGLFMLRRHPGLWPVPTVVLAVMGVHLVLLASQRFAVPVEAQIYLVASVALASVARSIVRRGGAAIAAAAAVLLWVLVAQGLSLPGSYRVEAKLLEGIAAANRPDPLAASGVARFADAAGGPRPIAFLAAEAFPRGAFVVRVYARATDCSVTSAPALSILMRNEDRVLKFRDTFTVGDLCRAPGYNLLQVRGILRGDEIIYLSVDTLGTVGLWVDRLEVKFGYRQLRQVPLIVP